MCDSQFTIISFFLSHPVIKKYCDKVDKTCTSDVLKVDQPLLILYITDLRKSWIILNLSKNCIETEWIWSLVGADVSLRRGAQVIIPFQLWTYFTASNARPSIAKSCRDDASITISHILIITFQNTSSSLHFDLMWHLRVTLLKSLHFRFTWYFKTIQFWQFEKHLVHISYSIPNNFQYF